MVSAKLKESVSADSAPGRNVAVATIERNANLDTPQSI
jgi:hypothetical protein